MMNKYGLTDERYNQMLEAFDGDEDFIVDSVSEWGVEDCNKGYAIFDYDGTGMLEIEAINDCGLYDDEEATKNAIKDGVKIIPVEELPVNFDKRYLGWIDTEENRKCIEDYSNKRLRSWKNVCV